MRIKSISKWILILIFILDIKTLAWANSKHFAFDLTGSFHGYGDVTGPFWTLLDIKRLYAKENNENHFSVILDGRSEEILKVLYRCSSMDILEKNLGVKFVRVDQVSSQPKADYLFQLFYGGRRIESFDFHPISGPNTVTLISDTMHGSKFDEVRLGTHHYYFKPPGIGEERSGIITSPDLKLFQNPSYSVRKAILRNKIKKIPLISRAQYLFEKEGMYSNVKFSFLYGIHNEILNHSGHPELQGQTKEYIHTLNKLSKNEAPVIVFTPNSEEQIRKTMADDPVNVLSLDDIKSRKRLENKVYFLPIGEIPNQLFTGLMSVSDFPVMVEGNSSISTAIRLNVPFVIYRSLWNGAQIRDLSEMEKKALGSCHYQIAYETNPSGVESLLTSLTEPFRNGEGALKDIPSSTVGAKISEVLSSQTQELSSKLYDVIRTFEKMKLKEREGLVSQESTENQIHELMNDVQQGKQDEVLGLSILKDAFNFNRITPSFYQNQIEKLADHGINISEIEANMVPNRPNFSEKFEHLSGIASETERAHTEAIIRGLRSTPKREIQKDPEVNAYLKEHKVYVSMTTSPQRIDQIYHVIDSLDLDHVEQILISLPKKFGRDDSNYTIPPELRNHPKVKILWVPEDYGPITKMIPAIGYVKKKHSDSDQKAIVISVDDDIGYPQGAINELIYQSIKNKDSVVSGSGYVFPGDLYFRINGFPTVPQDVQTNHDAGVRSVHMVEGWGGIAYKTDQVDLNFLKALSNISKVCFASDDLVISFALAIDQVSRKGISNDYLRWEMLRSLPYGEREDALHKGAGLLDDSKEIQGSEHGNHKKYKQCFDQLMRAGYDSETGKFRSKPEILRKIREFYGDGLNPKIKWRSELIDDINGSP